MTVYYNYYSIKFCLDLTDIHQRKLDKSEHIDT